MADSGKQSEENDDLISQFLAVTGSSNASRAQAYLEMSGFDLQTAVGLYLEHAGGSGASAAAMGGIRAPDEVQRTRLIGGSDARDAMMERIATAMYAQEDNYRSTAFSSNYMDIDTGGIPDAREIANRAAARQAERRAADHEEDDENTSSDYDVDDENEAPRRSSRLVTPASRLQNMFAPPDNILHKAGGFDGARNVARDTRRWLLVNLQRDSDFSCHALNRDVWRDDLVENLVKEGFVFWQAFDVSSEGRTYAERYSVKSYPHIAIIDPRTRRLMYRKEGWTQVNPLTAEMFAEVAADFCSKHSFDRPPVLPRPSAGGGAERSAAVESISTSAAARGVATGPKRPKKELTEEQQLQAAIRASMNGSLANDDSDSDDDSFKVEDFEDEYTMECDGKDNDDSATYIEEALSDEVEFLGVTSSKTAVPLIANATVSVLVEAKVKSFEEEIATMEVGDEPGAGARIMLRMPDGKRLVRKFCEDDVVKTIYAFVAQTNDDAKDGKLFELKTGFPPKNLLSNINDTIQSCGLAGDTITVRWKT